MRSGTHFMIQARNGSKDACETFYFAGANAYYLVRVGLSHSVNVTAATLPCFDWPVVQTMVRMVGSA